MPASVSAGQLLSQQGLAILGCALGGLFLLGEAVVLRMRRGPAMSVASVALLIAGAFLLFALSLWMLSLGFSQSV